ncbi:MAG: electron transport complex subunit RsxC [Gammaproteobacteria bacterium]
MVKTKFRPQTGFMNRELHEFPGGVKFKTYKEMTDTIPAIQHPLPNKIILPVRQHIGIPSVPIVKIGEQVLKGQMIADADGYVSIPLHASTSGKVIDIDDYAVPHAGEHEATCIVIEPDGEDKWFDIHPTDDYLSIDPKKLQEIIRSCGIAGLGGAGFPAHVKLHEGVVNTVETLIINGVECEPFITCDDRLIQEKAHYVVSGTRMIRHAVQAKNCVIAVEDDMPEAYEALAKWIDDDIELVMVPTRYPAGGEKQLIQTLTGKEVPSGGSAIHIGIVMQNVATAASVYRAVTRGEPVISRYVTITGDVGTPRNLQVLLGTPIRDCLEACGYQHNDNHRIILGGPMMGIHIRNTDIPIIKTTNCILVNQIRPIPEEMPCIRCGDCFTACPIKLLPQELYWHAKTENFAETQNYHIFDCIECGCCSYVCPSNIPLVQYFRYAKTQIAAEERRLDGADHAKKRFLMRQERILAEEEDKISKLEKSQIISSATITETEDKKSYIKEAVTRTRKKRSEIKQRQSDQDKNND